MAHIYKRKSGTWTLSVGSGKTRRTKNLGHDERLARLRLAEVRAEIERGRAGFPAPPDANLGARIDAYLERVKVNSAAATYARYRQYAHHFIDFFGPWAKLTAADLERYKAHRLAEGVKSKTVNNELIFIRTTHGEHGSHPFRAVRNLKVKDAKDARFLAPEEARRLVEAADEDFRDYIWGYLYTGARKNELTGMVWADIDMRRKVLRLQNYKTAGRQPHDKWRHVPIHPHLAEVLAARKRAGLSVPFPAPDNPNNLRIRLITTAKRAGIQGLTRIHDLRHAFAGALASKGVSLYVIQKLLGHTSIVTTQIYAHLMPETYEDAVALLDFEKGKEG